jgi:hypothetical protein
LRKHNNPPNLVVFTTNLVEQGQYQPQLALKGISDQSETIFVILPGDGLKNVMFGIHIWKY